jgi:AcrR family transcriptional regulator
MGRPSKYSCDVILDAAASLVADGGPAALTTTAVACALGAPSGSIYHRFASRELLAGSLWIRALERFQMGCFAALAHDDPREGVRAAAQFVLVWCRENLDDARLLMLYRSSDFVEGDWPPSLQESNRRLRNDLDRAIRDVNTRLGATSKSDRRRVLFAVVDIPSGAVRGPLRRGVGPEKILDAIVDDAVVATIAGISGRNS